MYHKFFILFFLLISTKNFAAEPLNKILVCLGNEELQYHKKKYTGPTYELNKTLISKMIQLNKSANIKDKYINEICNSETPSLTFLKLVLTKKSIFHVDSLGNDLNDNIAKSSIDDIRDSSPQIFLNFITYLKSISPSAYCLEKQIPEIDSMFNNVRYLEGEYSLRSIMQTDNRVSVILNKIKNWEAIITACYADIKKAKEKEKKIQKAESEI